MLSIQKHIFSYLSILWLLTTTSCDKTIVMDAGEEPKVVVECILTTEPEQSLYLSYTKGASKSESQVVTEASIVLLDMTKSKTIGQFSKTDRGNWTLKYSAIPTHQYRIEVEVPNRALISAEQTMPIVDVKAEFTSWIDSSQPYDGLERPYKSSMYTIYSINSLPNNTWIYAMCYNQQTGKREIAEDICTDYPLVDNFNLTGGIYSPEIHTEIEYELESKYALYPDLFGKSIHRRFLCIPKGSDIYNFGCLIISGDFKGKMYSNLHKKFLKLENDGKALNVPDDEGYIVFAAVSDEYDKYLRKAIQSQQLQESTDLSSIYVRDNVYSNINGGLGIFGAINEEKMQWTSIESLVIED